MSEELYTYLQRFKPMADKVETTKTHQIATVLVAVVAVAQFGLQEIYLLLFSLLLIPVQLVLKLAVRLDVLAVIMAQAMVFKVLMLLDLVFLAATALRQVQMVLLPYATPKQELIWKQA